MLLTEDTINIITQKFNSNYVEKDSKLSKNKVDEVLLISDEGEQDKEGYFIMITQ